MSDPTNPRFLTQTQKTEFDQVTTGLVLVKLLQEGAPAAQWLMSDRGTYLDGQLMMHTSTSTDKRRALAEWQRILGAGPVTSTTISDGRAHLSIVGSYEGVPVNVATIVDADDAPGAVAA